MDESRLHRTNRALFERLEPRQLFATISGMVFLETDADGLRESGEKGVADKRVYVDTNLDGKWQSSEASTRTNSKGQYSFTTKLAGLYRIRLRVPEGHRQTSPGRLFHDITSDGDDIHAANDFGLTTTAVVRGNVFDDANGDGLRQVIERGLAGVRVYIDENTNGIFDDGEKSRITDRVGEWRFAGVSAGRYRIRIDAPGSLKVTTPSRGFIIVDVKKAQGLGNRVIGVT